MSQCQNKSAKSVNHRHNPWSRHLIIRLWIPPALGGGALDTSMHICTSLESEQKRNRRNKTQIQRSKYFWYHFEICGRGVRSQRWKIIKIWYNFRIGFISKQYSLCFFSNVYKKNFGKLIVSKMLQIMQLNEKKIILQRSTNLKTFKLYPVLTF